MLLHVPLSILASIACKLNISSILCLASISKTLQAKINAPVVWAEVFERDFYINAEEVQEKRKNIEDWQQLYRFFHVHRLFIYLQITPGQFTFEDEVKVQIRLQNVGKCDLELKKEIDCSFLATECGYKAANNRETTKKPLILSRAWERTYQTFAFGIASANGIGYPDYPIFLKLPPFADNVQVVCQSDILVNYKQEKIVSNFVRVKFVDDREYFCNLIEKENHLSRLWQTFNKISNFNKNQQNTDQLAQKLEELQHFLNTHDEVREQYEKEEFKRYQHGERVKELITKKELGALTSRQKERRKKNWRSLIISLNGNVTEEAFDDLERKEKETDAREKREHQDNIRRTEEKLNVVNIKLRRYIKQKVAQNLVRLQSQLDMVELKLKEWEKSGTVSNFEEFRVNKDKEVEEQIQQLQICKEKKIQKWKQQMVSDTIECEPKEHEKTDALSRENADSTVEQANVTEIPPYKINKIISQRMELLENEAALSYFEALAKKRLAQMDQIIVCKISGDEFVMTNKAWRSSHTGLCLEELKIKIADFQKIIFDENAKENEIVDANIQLERLMDDYEKTDEFRAKKAEKRLESDKLNKIALEKVRAKLTQVELKGRLLTNPELKLLFLKTNEISKLPQNEFTQYSLRGLSYEELRALRGCLPIFRSNQSVQLNWVERLDNKISENEKEKTIHENTIVATRPKKWKRSPGTCNFADVVAEIRSSSKDVLPPLPPRGSTSPGAINPNEPTEITELKTIIDQITQALLEKGERSELFQQWRNLASTVKSKGIRFMLHTQKFRIFFGCAQNVLDATEQRKKVQAKQKLIVAGHVLKAALDEEID